jgi:putative ABC transport system ATP-binding protein
MFAWGDNMVIEIQDITKTYITGDISFQALRGVTFHVRAGEFIAIMGPSGSGKSTLMQILGALDKPTSGKYFFKGKDVSFFSEDELADVRKNEIGFVFQSFNLLPRTTALRNTMLPMVYLEVTYADREKRARAALLSVGINEDHFCHKSNQLSGGQIQRVAIARALVNNPSIILADEPTGNLDSKTGELVLGTFQRLHEKEGKTIILITHEREIAEHTDRILLMKDGLLVKDEKTHKKIKAHHHSTE